MDRRKFLTATAAVTVGAPMTVMAAKDTVNIFPKGITKTDLNIYQTDILGETVELQQFDEFDGSKVKIWWRSNETPKRVFALAFHGTFRDTEKVETLKMAMSRSIRWVRSGRTSPDLMVPIKPEGCATQMI